MARLRIDYRVHERVMAVAAEWRRPVKRLVTVPLGRVLAEYSGDPVECPR